MRKYFLIDLLSYASLIYNLSMGYINIYFGILILVKNIKTKLLLDKVSVEIPLFGDKYHYKKLISLLISIFVVSSVVTCDFSTKLDSINPCFFKKNPINWVFKKNPIRLIKKKAQKNLDPIRLISVDFKKKPDSITRLFFGFSKKNPIISKKKFFLLIISKKKKIYFFLRMDPITRLFHSGTRFD